MRKIPGGSAFGLVKLPCVLSTHALGGRIVIDSPQHPLTLPKLLSVQVAVKLNGSVSLIASD